MREVQYDDRSTLTVGDATFCYAFPLPPDLPLSVLPLLKPRLLIDRYIKLFRDDRPQQIVEIGIHRGGSTAFISAVAEPAKLVAMELVEEPAEPLSRFIESRGLEDAIRPHYGVDQSDRAAMAEIADREFGSTPIDAVIDDASHLYGPTLASFEVLFPRLKPGGVYVIEDWAVDNHLAHGMASMVAPDNEALADNVDRIVDSVSQQYQDDPSALAALIDSFRADPDGRIKDVCRAVIDGQGRVPLARLALELVLSQAEIPGAYDSVTATEGWVMIRRGDTELDRNSFRVSQTWRDYYSLLDGNVGTSVSP